MSVWANEGCDDGQGTELYDSKHPELETPHITPPKKPPKNTEETNKPNNQTKPINQTQEWKI